MRCSRRWPERDLGSGGFLKRALLVKKGGKGGGELRKRGWGGGERREVYFRDRIAEYECCSLRLQRQCRVVSHPGGNQP